jgi:hypothetical protein
VAKLAVAGFDYANASRGYWARLRDGGGRDVLLTQYPETLLAMLRAGVLVGEAKADAEKLKILGESRPAAGS